VGRVKNKLKMTKKGEKRKSSPRLQGYDYSSEGAYFLTLVTHQRQHLFGEVSEDMIQVSDFGEIAFDQWFLSAEIRNEINLYQDEFVVMPNHVHGIVWITNSPATDYPFGAGATGQSPLREGGEAGSGPGAKSLSAFVVGYKSSVTKRVNVLRDSPGDSVWMRNYHDRVIRNSRQLNAIRKYILENPLKWELDSHWTG
jgi:REP element-mobilizing transposase RayT